MSCHFPLYISERACPATARSTAERPTGRGQKTRWRKQRRSGGRKQGERRHGGDHHGTGVCVSGGGGGGRGRGGRGRGALPPFVPTPIDTYFTHEARGEGWSRDPPPQTDASLAKESKLPRVVASLAWSPRRPSQPRRDHRHRHRSRLPPVRRVALVVATHARRLWSRQRRRQMTTTQLRRTWNIT